MHRIRKGDRVVVTTGRDNGRTGTVILFSTTTLSWWRT